MKRYARSCLIETICGWRGPAKPRRGQGRGRGRGRYSADGSNGTDGGRPRRTMYRTPTPKITPQTIHLQPTSRTETFYLYTSFMSITHSHPNSLSPPRTSPPPSAHILRLGDPHTIYHPTSPPYPVFRNAYPYVQPARVGKTIHSLRLPAQLRIPTHSSILHSSFFTPVSRSGRRVSFFLVTCSTSLGRVCGAWPRAVSGAIKIVSRAGCDTHRVVDGSTPRLETQSAMTWYMRWGLSWSR